jgi:hypothetical protein
VELDSFVVDLAGDNGLEAQGRPADEAGEPEAADGGGEEAGAFRGGTEQAGAIGAEQLELCNVAAEGSGGVMVFAVNVVGIGSTRG